MLCAFVIVAHWFACIWYVIGREDLKSGTQYGWLSTLANKVPREADTTIPRDKMNDG